MVFQQQLIMSSIKSSGTYRLTSRFGWVFNHSSVQNNIRRNIYKNKVYKRFLFSSCNGVWENPLTSGVLKDIEVYWKKKVPKEVNEAQKRISGEKENKFKKSHDYYVLSMFPYPSGQLHMGHVRVYSISDAMAHYYRMAGPYRVLHPMGWDAFGLPAENAAIKMDIKPQDWTSSNTAKMREQLDSCGFHFDWDREISTCDPSYYKWTQWLFLKMYDAGLAYQEEAMVNWDPIDQTVLADEQVDVEGRSWRSGAKVEKRPLKQWFLRTTEYSKDLYDGLDDPTLKDWRDIIKIQRNWIGECNGVKFRFKLDVAVTDSEVAAQSQPEFRHISVWTAVPEMVLGVGFIGISPDHILVKSVGGLPEQEKFSAFGYRFCQLRNVMALNPFFAEPTPIPILVISPDHTFERQSELGLFPDGADAFLGVPETSEVHAGILKSFTNENIEPKKKVLSEDGTFQNCGHFNGLRANDEGRNVIIDYARKHRIGGYWTSSKLQVITKYIKKAG